jgi:hypothetical protein
MLQVAQVAVCSEINIKHQYTVGRIYNSGILKMLVHHVTSRLEKVKPQWILYTTTGIKILKYLHFSHTVCFMRFSQYALIIFLNSIIRLIWQWRKKTFAFR